MSVELYFNPLSQPSRAIHALLLLGHIPHNLHVIDLMKQEQNTPEYKKISPTGQVPAIVDGELSLIESHAILKYLARKNKLEQYYPSDIVEQAKLDQYLDWHHGGTRNVTFTARDLVFYPKFLGKPVPENKEDRLKELAWYFTAFEEIFLANGKNDYILGFKQPTIADISAVSEITTAFLLNVDFSAHPHLLAYLKRVLAIPEVKQAHQVHFGFTKAHTENLRQEIVDLIQ